LGGDGGGEWCVSNGVWGERFELLQKWKGGGVGVGLKEPERWAMTGL